MIHFRNNFARSSHFIALAMLFALLAGCGESLPRTVPVRGKVTWQGKPLTTGTVTFEPISSDGTGLLRPAHGSLNDDGIYRLSSFRTDDGAQPGQYAVVITSYTNIPSIDAMGQPPQWAIPASYGRADTSGLSATISPDATGEVEINFDLPLKGTAAR